MYANDAIDKLPPNIFFRFCYVNCIKAGTFGYWWLRENLFHTLEYVIGHPLNISMFEIKIGIVFAYFCLINL